MNRDFFLDFSSVSYNRIKKRFFLFLCFTVLCIVTNILVFNYDIVMITLFIPIFLSVLYLGVGKAAKRNYERSLISEGKEVTIYGKLYENKMVSGIRELEREYSYNQITKFYETKNFLLLHLQLHLYLTIDKATLNADVDEVKSFLIQKCPSVKNKKLVNCSNDKKWALIFLILLAFVSIAGIIISLILKYKMI